MKLEKDYFAVTALIFSVVFAVIGLIMGIVGVNLYEKDSKGRLMSAIAICYSACNLIAGICILQIL